MESIYLRQVDFHTLTDEEEIFELQRFQNRHMAKSWVKRLIISFVCVAIFVIFQLGARAAAPNMFGEADTIDKLLRNSIYVFLGFNILSWLELMFESKVMFDIEKGKVAKLVVKKKMVVEVNNIVPFRFRFLVCEHEGAFVLDRVYIRGYISYTNVKEGQTIYVERIHDEGHYQYYYLA